MGEWVTTVYIVRMVDTSYCKIGITEWADVADRMNVIQQCCPRRLEIVLEFPGGDRQFENKLHNIFANKRLDGGMEWFELDESDIQRLKDRFFIDGEFVPPEKPRCITQRLTVSKIDYEVMQSIQRGEVIEVTKGGMEAYVMRCPVDDSEAMKFVEAMREVRRYRSVEEEAWTSVTTP